MTDTDITRRRVLQTVGAGVGTAGVATTVSGGRAGDRYMVGLEAGADISTATELATEVSREIDFGDIGTAVAGRYDETALEQLRRDPNVRYVEPDEPVQLVEPSVGTSDEEPPEFPYGIQITDAKEAIQEAGLTGDGATVAVVDTGIVSTHPALAENIVDGFAPIECGEGLLPFETVEADCEEPWGDDHGHGTHVAGSAAAADNDEGVVGVAPEADLLAVKSLSANGAGLPSAISDGITWAADNGADVINMSLGGPIPQPGLGDAVDYAIDNGVSVVAAAGNSGGDDPEPCEDCVGYPAAFEDTVGVSATDADDQIAFFSSTGPEVDLAAPGVGVWSSSCCEIGGPYAQASGTSMAAPHVAGAVASVVGGGADPHEAEDILETAADDVGLPAEYQGAGRLNVADAVEDIPEPTPVEVSTETASDVGETAATLSGTLDDLDGYDEAEVLFEYGPVGSGLPESVDAGTASEGETFTAAVDGLEPGTTYEFVALAIAGGGTETGEGLVNSFETDEEMEFCFVTTATAGDTATLDSLRRFRDESMATTPVGRGLVGLYYRVSPPVARSMARNPDSTEAAATRGLVDRCANLSDRQAETDSPVGAAMLGCLLTALYLVGLVVGILGHASLQAREALGR